MSTPCDGCGVPTPAPHTTRLSRPAHHPHEFKWCSSCCPDHPRVATKPARTRRRKGRRKAPPEKMSMNP